MRTLFFPRQSIYRGDLILVNASHPVQEEPSSPELTTVNQNYPHIFLRNRAAQMLNALIREIDADQHIVPVSGYRNALEQATIFEDCLREEGVGYTANFVALPNCSEHQTGLAIDLSRNQENIDFVCPDFPYSGICQAFRQTAANYGFIERYQEGKEAITGIACEPWHFRYVGWPHARMIQENNWALEEYIDHLKEYRQESQPFTCQVDGRQCGIFFLPATGESGFSVALPDNAYCQVSGNNEDGLIITVWGMS